MQIVNPYALLLLPAVPLLFWLVQRAGKIAAVSHSTVGELARVRPTWAVRLRRVLPFLRAIAMILLVLALARPQWGIETTRIYREGIAVTMVVDISSSMGAVDLKIGDETANRLDVVKTTFKAFIEGEGDDLGGREGDLIGMVTFARFPDALSPLTLDHEALLNLLEEVAIVELAEEDGTAIGDAIILGIDRLRRTSGASRVMIMLTDGSNNAGDTDPVQAAQIAKALGIRIYTIGAGTRGTAMIPVRENGVSEMRPTQVFIDEHTLRQIATNTGGAYYRATDADALRTIYAEIDRMEKGTHVAESYQQYTELFPYLVALALLLVLIEFVLRATRLRTVP